MQYQGYAEATSKSEEFIIIPVNQLQTHMISNNSCNDNCENYYDYYKTEVKKPFNMLPTVSHIISISQQTSPSAQFISASVEESKNSPVSETGLVDVKENLSNLSPKNAIGFTLETSTTFTNTTVSGIKNQSYLKPDSVFDHNINLRLLGENIFGGYVMDGNFKTLQTTDSDKKSVRADRFSFSFDEPGRFYSLGDLTPKFSKYTMKNYTLQGIQYLHKGTKNNQEFIFGRAPKRNKVSQYQRFAGGIRYATKSETSPFGISLVRTFDVGNLQKNEPKNNNWILSADFSRSIGKNWVSSVEYGKSSARVSSSDKNLQGSAISLTSKYSKPATKLQIGYEKIGENFRSETSFFSRGRREFSIALKQALKYNTAVTTNYKNILLGNKKTEIIPFMVSSNPIRRFANCKFTATKSLEKRRGFNLHQDVYNSTFQISTKVGISNVSIENTKKTTKEKDNSLLAQKTNKMNVRSSITDGLVTSLTYRLERKYKIQEIITRGLRVGIVWEPVEWTEVNFAIERFYANSPAESSKRVFQFGYKQMDIIHDKEYGIEYEFSNYRDHNDTVFKLRYTFYI